MGWTTLAVFVGATWSRPDEAPEPVDLSGRDPVGVVVDARSGSIDELERTLVGLKMLRGAGHITILVDEPSDAHTALAGRLGPATIHTTSSPAIAHLAGKDDPLVLWLEAGHITAPDLLERTVPRIAPGVATCQVAVGWLDANSLARLRSGREQHALMQRVIGPSLSRRGAALWEGAGSLVRPAALRPILRNGAITPSRLRSDLMSSGWRTVHEPDDLIRGVAPTALDEYLARRRRRTSDEWHAAFARGGVLRAGRPDLARRLGPLHRILTAATGLRLLLLAVLTTIVVISGSVPFGVDATAVALPATVLGFGNVVVRRLLAGDAMGVGDWTRQAWRTLPADLPIQLDAALARPRLRRARGWLEHGVTANDAPDSDGVVNFPVITNVQRVAGDLIVDFTLDVAAGDHRVELFGNTTADGSGFGEGETFLGGATITHAGGGIERFQITVAAPATIVTATTTQDLGGGTFGATSEFSAGAPSPDLVIVNSTADVGDALLGDGRCDTGGTNALGDPECTYRAAIEEANDGGSPVDTIWFDIPVADVGHLAGVWTIAPATALPQVTAPVTIDGATQPGHLANTAAAPLPLDNLPVIEIDGANSGDGIHLATGAAGSTVNALAIGGFSGGGNYGIEVRADDVTITGSVIGLRADGVTDNPSAYGVYVQGAARTMIGGTTPAARNLIAGSQNSQITLSPGTDVQILGNILGADVTTLVVPGGWGSGLQLWSGDNVTVGSPTAPNVIGSAPGEWGIEGGADNVTIEGNLIGTDATYTADLGGWQGIGGYSSTMNIIGDVIGNWDEGVHLDADTITLTGNAIGTDPTGTIDLGNTDYGVQAWGDDGAVIGGATLADANLIAFNGGPGIDIRATINDPTIRINRIWNNAGLGVDHDNDGPSTNDAGDLDGLPNAPVLISGLTRNGVTELTFGLDAPAGTYRIDLYANPSGIDPSGFGEGEVHVDSFDLVHPGGSATHVVPVAGGVSSGLSATATHPSQATSEFSNTITTVDAAAATVDDASQRRSDLISLDGATDSATGLVGAALDVVGGSSRLIGPGLDLTGTALTMGAFVEADALSGDHVVVSKLDGAGNVVYELAVDGIGGEAVATIRLDGAPVTARGGALTDATWHGLVATWDGVFLALFVDGVEVDRVAATGTLATDPTTEATVGNRTDRSRPFDGRIDHLVVLHRAADPAETMAIDRAATDPSSFIAVGAEQRSTPGEWTVTSTRTRSGAFSLEAPQTSGADAPAWAIATGIDEPGLVFESYWWFDVATGIDLAAGTRTGALPTDQYEAALTGFLGWEVRQRVGSAETTDAAAAGTPTAGRWVKVEIWTDQLNRTRIVIDGVETTAWTTQGAALDSGSAALRVGELQAGNGWYVDDPRARRLVTPEPIASLAPIDRN